MDKYWKDWGPNYKVWAVPDFKFRVRVKDDHHGAFKVCLTGGTSTLFEEEAWGYTTFEDALVAGEALAGALYAVFRLGSIKES